MNMLYTGQRNKQGVVLLLKWQRESSHCIQNNCGIILDLLQLRNDPVVGQNRRK